MAMINRVYQTVLTIINKDNRGYLTPDEFNRLANQAQNEIFESYFVKKFQLDSIGVMTDGPANPPVIFADKINRFLTTSVLTANAAGTFDYPTDYYRLDNVTVPGTDGFSRIADQVDHNDIRYVILSPLTSPTAKQPVYTRQGDGVRLYPSSVTSINLDYIRKPAIPNWAYGYIDTTTMQLMQNPSSSTQSTPTFWEAPNVNTAIARGRFQDFELHPSDEQDLVAKILAYTGVVIRDLSLIHI